MMINETSVNVFIRQTVIIICKVYGFPRPRVTWLKNGEEISDNSHYNTSKFSGNSFNSTSLSFLKVEAARRNDSANYTCLVRNAAGSDHDMVSLVVLGEFCLLYLKLSLRAKCNTIVTCIIMRNDA